MFTVNINEELCKGCVLCVSVCPKDVLEMSTELNNSGNVVARVKLPENCIGCQGCTLICPDACIEVTNDD